MRTAYKKPIRRPAMVGIYKRKLVFFSLFFLLVFGISTIIRNYQYSADVSPLVTDQQTASTTIVSVELNSDGSVVVDGKKTNRKASLLGTADEIRMPVLEAPGVDYDLVQIFLKLPQEVAYDSTFEVLAIHGAGQTHAYVKDKQTIVYEVSNVSSFATVSIVADLPKGTIKPPLIERVGQALSSIRLNVWLFLGLGMPIISTIFMLAFVLYQMRRQRVDLPEREASFPPMAIPPAIAGVLIHQRVRAREIAATLVDLAIRGDIVIIDRERGFVFGKGVFDQRLLNYEKMLLAKIFHQDISSDKAEIEQRINSHLYSHKMSIVSDDVYNLATRLGYFKTNPQKIHAKFRYIGIVAFTIGLLGFILSLLYFTNPPYIVFFWVGMMVSSLIVAVTASNLPIRTVLGQEALNNWLAFRKYLTNPDPIPYTNNLPDLFNRYLPYAIALDCETAWARRFSAQNFLVPSWFVTEKSGLGLEEFCLAVFPIISYVSRSLLTLREPGTE